MEKNLEGYRQITDANIITIVQHHLMQKHSLGAKAVGYIRVFANHTEFLVTGIAHIQEDTVPYSDLKEDRENQSEIEM